MPQELSIIIPAAGVGRKMKYYGCKSLIELNGTHTVISRQQQLLKTVYPKAEIIVVVGYEADAVIAKLQSDIKPVENENFATTNVVRSIAMGLRIASYDNVLIVYGDLVFNKPAVNIANNNGFSVALVDNKKRMSDDEVGLTVVNGRITRFSYDLKTKWGQITYLTGKELKLFKDVVYNKNHIKWFGFEALNDVLEKGGVIRPVEPERIKIVEIDTFKNIENARNILRRNK